MALAGKTVLITGAARRVGRSLALGVAAAGGNLVIHFGHSRNEAENLKTEIRTLGQQAHLLQADLADVDQVGSLIPRALEYGPLFALVNNAAIFEPLDWNETRLEDWNRNLMINLTTPFLLSQTFARSLPDGANGRIVNILDWRSERPGADHLPYTISKAALAALTRSLAQAFAPRITVNGLALGAILPPIHGQADEKIINNVPARRWAELEEVNQALLFFLEGPTYISGEIMHVDGGRHLV